jgi:DNA-binding NtrC family response regulator
MAKVLIVDDQPHLQELFSEELRDQGHSVQGVGDAESAKVAMKDSKPDLVLLDLRLDKGFEGWELLHQIKDSNPELPVLIVTAYDSYAKHPGLNKADGYVVKSFVQFDKLKQKINDLLKQRPLGMRET